jgi:hypothetical protein
MTTEVEQLRELARAYWKDGSAPCPKHPGVTMTGSFVETTFADHIVLTCPRGRESITIPQRPKQTEFQAQQVEGYVENLQRGDAILCYRCQSSIETESHVDTVTGASEYTFTCVRCLSWGRWNSS